MKFTQYFSGCTNISDFVGTSEIAQKPVCIVANDVSQKVMPKIVNALNSGLKIMIDSGAFPRYKANLKRQSNNMSLLADLDFNEVFESYDRIIKQISVENYSNLTIVAPDKIGDQEKTLELQQKYRQKITGYINQKVNIMLPIQKGKISPSKYYRKLTKILGTSDFVVAIPSCEQAFTDLDIENLYQSDKPKKIHLLGISTANRNFPSKVALLKTMYSEVELSADANRLRAKIGKKAPITRFQRRPSNSALHKAYQSHSEIQKGWEGYKEIVSGDIELNENDEKKIHRTVMKLCGFNKGFNELSKEEVEHYGDVNCSREIHSLYETLCLIQHTSQKSRRFHELSLNQKQSTIYTNKIRSLAVAESLKSERFPVIPTMIQLPSQMPVQMNLF